MTYPKAIHEDKVGTYPAAAKAGGGYVWDAVLEYRVWCHPDQGAPDLEEGHGYYYAFASYDEVLAYAKHLTGADEPLALVFLKRPKRTPQTIPDFLAPDAPPNRLDILRGISEP